MAMTTNTSNTEKMFMNFFDFSDKEITLKVNENEKEFIAEDNDFDCINTRVKDIEEEAAKLRQLESDLEREMYHCIPVRGTRLTLEEKIKMDSRSVYVGNVDYQATKEELEKHFHGCGPINRVSILCNKYDGHPKGFAYIEFADSDSVKTAIVFDGTVFRNRQIRVTQKRTNVPGRSSTDRPPRGFYRGGFSRASAFRGRGRVAFISPRGNPRFRNRESHSHFTPY